ncbi:hypothetical protein Sango_1211400, partial [Sesamum angolense]
CGIPGRKSRTSEDVFGKIGNSTAVDKNRNFGTMWRKSLSPNFPYFQTFSNVSSERREEILLSWSTSYFLLLRILFTALKMITLFLFFTQ